MTPAIGRRAVYRALGSVFRESGRARGGKKEFIISSARGYRAAFIVDNSDK